MLRSRGIPICLVAILAAACTTAPAPYRAALVTYNHWPTVSDAGTLYSLGAETLAVIPKSEHVIAKGHFSLQSCTQATGVVHCDDLGTQSDPILSLYLQVIDTILPSDTTYLRGLGASALSVESPNTITAAVGSSSAVDIGKWTRAAHVSLFVPGSLQ